MKKFLSMICALMLLFCVSTASAACSHDNVTNPGDAGVYYEYKQYSDTYHYQSVDMEFICLDCGYSYIMGWITDDLLPHKFSGNKCTQCGYTRSDSAECKHTSVEESPFTYYSWEDEYVHRQYWGYYLICSACGEITYDSGDMPSEETETHTFSNNKCTQCGYMRSSTGTYTKEDYMADLQKAAYKLGDNLIDSTAKVVYTGDIRASDSNTARILGKAYADETYRVVDYKVHAKGDIWLEIEYGKQTAWVSAGLVKIMLPVSEVGGAMPHLVGATVVVRVNSGYGLDAPGTDAVAIRTVVRGQKYKILDCAYDSRGKLWYKIKVNEQECWIASGCMAWP